MISLLCLFTVFVFIWAIFLTGNYRDYDCNSTYKTIVIEVPVCVWNKLPSNFDDHSVSEDVVLDAFGCFMIHTTRTNLKNVISVVTTKVDRFPTMVRVHCVLSTGFVVIFDVIVGTTESTIIKQTYFRGDFVSVFNFENRAIFVHSSRDQWELER